MLSCYPPSTRAEFSEEMQHIFERCVADHSERSALGPVALFLRELRDWPVALIHAYRSEIQQHLIVRKQALSGSMGALLEGSELLMNTSEEFIAQNSRQSLWMSLPPLLLGLGIMCAAMIRTDVWYRLPAWRLYLSIAVTLLPGLFVGVVGLIALYRRIPDWGITWLGSAFMGFVLTLQVLLGEMVDEGTIVLAPAFEIALGLLLFFSGLTLMLVLAMRGWTRSGMFTLAAAATMGLSLVQAVTAAPFNRDDLALLAGPIGLVFALLIYVYALRIDRSRWAVLTIAGVLNVILVMAMAQAISGWSMAPEAISFAPPLLVLITGLLVAGPLSGLIVKPLLGRLV
jgi:hypothetical protein